MPTRVTPYLGGTGQNNTAKINVHPTLQRVSIGADILGNANLVVYGNSYANVAEGAATRFANATIFNTANASVNIFSSAANARFDMGAAATTFSQILYSGVNASNIRFVARNMNNAFVEINEFTFMNNAYVRGNLFVSGTTTISNVVQLNEVANTQTANAFYLTKAASDIAMSNGWTFVGTNVAHFAYGVKYLESNAQGHVLAPIKFQSPTIIATNSFIGANSYLSGNSYVSGSMRIGSAAYNGDEYPFTVEKSVPTLRWYVRNNNTDAAATTIQYLYGNSTNYYTRYIGGTSLQEYTGVGITTRYSIFDTHLIRSSTSQPILDITTARLASNTKIAITSTATAANLSVGGNAFVTGNVISQDSIGARGQIWVGSDTPYDSSNISVISASGGNMRLARTSLGDTQFRFTSSYMSGDGTNFVIDSIPGSNMPATGQGVVFRTVRGTGYGANIALGINRFGNVAIGGFTSPMANLHVQGNAYVTGGIYTPLGLAAGNVSTGYATAQGLLGLGKDLVGTATVTDQIVFARQELANGIAGEGTGIRWQFRTASGGFFQSQISSVIKGGNNGADFIVSPGAPSSAPAEIARFTNTGLGLWTMGNAAANLHVVGNASISSNLYAQGLYVNSAPSAVTAFRVFGNSVISDSSGTITSGGYLQRLYSAKPTILNMYYQANTTSGAQAVLNKYRGDGVTEGTSGEAIGELQYAHVSTIGSSTAIVRAFGILDNTAVGYGNVAGRFSVYTSEFGSTSAVERFRIDSQNRVMIGAGAPTSNLHVLGNAYILTNLTVGSDTVTNNSFIGANAYLSGNVVASYGVSAPRMAIGVAAGGTSANLYLVSSHGTLARIAKTGTLGDYYMAIGSYATGDGADLMYQTAISPATGSGYVWQTSIGTGYGNNTALVINRYGNVAVGGTLNPMSNLHVNGNAYISTKVTLGNTVTSMVGTTIGAGSPNQAFIKASATADLGFYYGTGDPTFSAAKGSIYSKTDATTTTTRLWVNTDGGTTWAFLTTSA